MATYPRDFILSLVLAVVICVFLTTLILTDRSVVMGPLCGRNYLKSLVLGSQALGRRRHKNALTVKHKRDSGGSADHYCRHHVA